MPSVDATLLPAVTLSTLSHVHPLFEHLLVQGVATYPLPVPHTCSDAHPLQGQHCRIDCSILPSSSRRRCCRRRRLGGWNRDGAEGQRRPPPGQRTGAETWRRSTLQHPFSHYRQCPCSQACSMVPRSGCARSSFRAWCGRDCVACQRHSSWHPSPAPVARFSLALDDSGSSSNTH